jgi:hypothetical protein
MLGILVVNGLGVIFAQASRQAGSVAVSVAS